MNENQHEMSHFEISRQFVVVLICSVAKVRPNKQLNCTKTSPFLTDFQILWIMYYLYFSFCQVLFGVGTHGRWSDLFLIFFFALWTPIGDIRGHSPKIRILHFQVVFFGVSPWNQITLAWLLCHLGLRDFWPAFAHCVVLPCQNLEPHLRLLRWSLVQSFFDFNPIADVGLYTTIDLYAACKLGWTCFFVVVAWGKVRSKTCDTKTVLHSNWNLQFKSCK